MGLNPLMPGPVFANVSELAVVEAGPDQRAIVHFEADRFNQMQAATGIDAQADDIAGIWWNFRLKQDDIKHVLVEYVGIV